MNRTAKAWIESESRAVCLVDWRWLARTFYETTSRKYVAMVGWYVAEMIRVQRFDPKTTIIVGHSLGAHIAGVSGYALNGSLSQIYGLDPAGPEFTKTEIIDEPNRLDPTDALHVQCLHTNMGSLGTSYPCGHSDYYANDGGRQPGCFESLCDHKRAGFIFEASINPENVFNAQLCHGMDSHVSDRFGIYGKHLNGQFCFKTTNCFPYVFDKTFYA